MNLSSYLPIAFTGFKYTDRFYHMSVSYKTFFLLQLIILDTWKGIKTLVGKVNGLHVTRSTDAKTVDELYFTMSVYKSTSRIYGPWNS